MQTILKECGTKSANFIVQKADFDLMSQFRKLELVVFQNRLKDMAVHLMQKGIEGESITMHAAFSTRTEKGHAQILVKNSSLCFIFTNTSQSLKTFSKDDVLCCHSIFTDGRAVGVKLRNTEKFTLTF